VKPGLIGLATALAAQTALTVIGRGTP